MLRKYLALCLCGAALALALPVLADRDALPARVAAGRFPVPTFADVHRAFVRICGNESGMKSLADQDGILQSLLNGGGGGRREGRRYRGQGYGLDYTKLMRRMTRHSKRTFPPDSKFLLLTQPMRARLARRQTRLNKWTSTLELDCRQPAGWPKYKLDGVTPMLPWRNFEERCRLLVETTRRVLQGKVESYCDGRPVTWGSEQDITKPDGAIAKGWTEVHCDRPPDTPETCGEKTKLELWNGTTCARNTFWTWKKTDKEDNRGDEEGAAPDSGARKHTG